VGRSEVRYVFGTLGYGHRRFTTSDHAISHRLQDCWANFIWTGNPAEPGLLKWPQRHSGNVMLLGDQRSTAPLLSKEQREAVCGWLAASGRIGLF
jgi:para-nitrobenzyl esterase